MSRAGRFTQRDCFGICYILPNQRIFRKHISHFFQHYFFHHRQNGFAGRIWPASRSLETPDLSEEVSSMEKSSIKF